SSRGQLGNLYDAMPGRRDEAVAYYRQAAEIHRELGDLRLEGQDCRNAAGTLVALGRFDEARAELERAIACDAQFGGNSEPWRMWGILHQLETASGNPA